MKINSIVSRDNASAWLIGLGVVAIAAIVIVAIVRDRLVTPPQWQVSVTGQAKIPYQPDIANVTLGVSVDKVARAEDALGQLNERMNRVIAALKAVGVAEADIQTQNYNLYPQYDFVDGVSRASGYSANQQVIVKVRDIVNNPTQVSRVIAESTKAGVNNVGGVAFDLSNLDEIKQQARVQAIADARSKAGAMARAAHVRLGEVVGWWENVIQAPGAPMPYYDRSAVGMGGAVSQAASPAVPSGTQEVIIEINLNYRVK